ncbi:MAG: cation-translocating P-type ATPase [Candidatus Bathyarchaeia archaeon]
MADTEKTQWHTLEVEDLFKKLGTGRVGLTLDEARKRLDIYGPNRLTEKRRISPLSIFLSQFKSILVVILAIAAAVSGYLAVVEGEPLTDSYVIVSILVLNAVLGFVQEYRAEKAVEALKKMVSPKVFVVRGGVEESIDSSGLVPGDLMVLQAGERIPADARVVEEFSLEVDEAVLTGESMPVEKGSEALPVDAPEKSNMLFMGTSVAGGRGLAVVTSTGMSTVFGGIAEMVQEIDSEEPPLKRKLEAMGRQLGGISLALCTWVFLVGVLIYKTPIEETLLTSISLAVSAIPEGLPAVLTITLALGVSAMARQKAIVRRLASVETLGSTTVICTDKTGTITKNEMTVTKITYSGREIDVTGAGYEPRGEFREHGAPVDPVADPMLNLSLKIGSLCNSATMTTSGGWSIHGDPTDGALLVAAAKAGIARENQPEKLLQEFAFESGRKRMSAVYRLPRGARISYVKGAPEEIIADSVMILDAEGPRRISEADREHLNATLKRWAGEALRVIGLAYRDLPGGEGEVEIGEAEKGLTFVGLAGMIDPPREEVKEAIRIATRAGITTMMLTGDYRVTAVAVARLVGIIDGQADGAVVEGSEIEKMTDEELDERVEGFRVGARVSPEHKMRIALALRRRGQIVAMTGDGVNDAPALKAADIGVAMGIKGADVTREASDMVLEDDNYATIVRAVEGGRRIYANISKYVRLMISANFDEFLMILVSISLGLPLPFLPIHILWVNLVTDGLPAIALSVDPAEEGLMRRPPRDPKEGLLSRYWRFIAFAALIAFAADFLPFYLIYGWTGDIAVARSAALTTIVIFELLLAYQVRSDDRHLFSQGWKGLTENRFLFASLLASLALQLAVVYFQPLQEIFRVAPLTLDQLALCVVTAMSAFLIVPRLLIKPRNGVVNGRTPRKP